MRDITSITPVRADHRIPYGTDENQFIDIFDPRANAQPATVIMIHGGFWRARYDLTHASHFCEALAQTGFHAANVEYRRVGNESGGWPGTFDDIVNACTAIRTYLPKSQLIVCGHSAGGHLALRLACDPVDLAGVVALAPVAVLQDAYDLHLSNDAVVEFMGGTPVQRPVEYDNACPSRHPLTVPAIVIHGTADDVVPISLSEGYSRARNGDPVRVIQLADTGHMELIDPAEKAFETVAAAINDLLR